MSPTASILPTLAEHLAQEKKDLLERSRRDDEMFARPRVTLAQAQLLANVYRELSVALRGGRFCLLSAGVRLKVAAEGYSYPDLMIVDGEPKIDLDDGAQTLLNPKVILDTYSGRSRGDDYGVRFSGYREISSVTQILFLARDRAQAQRHSRNENGQWLLTDAQGLDSVIEIPSVGATLALADVYERVLSA